MLFGADDIMMLMVMMVFNVKIQINDVALRNVCTGSDQQDNNDKFCIYGKSGFQFLFETLLSVSNN